MIRSLKNIFNLYMPNLLKIIGNRLIIREPGRVRAYQRIKVTGKGTVSIGSKCCFGFPLGGYFDRGLIELQARYFESIIEIGDRVATNNNLLICSKNRIVIGDDCLIGHNVEFMDFDGHNLAPSQRRNGDGIAEEIIIGKNVWFGNNVIILRGTQIGDNSVIAAGSVVKGRFGSNVVLGGVPARVIKSIRED